MNIHHKKTHGTDPKYQHVLEKKVQKQQKYCNGKVVAARCWVILDG
ncbi:hypothetical protein LINGRAPRIM_LOCUS2723 [Linum grandiflorum]